MRMEGVGSEQGQFRVIIEQLAMYALEFATQLGRAIGAY